MDWFLVILGGLLMVVGLIGAVVPVLPGPPISYVGLLLLHFTKWADFSSNFLIVMAVVAVVVTAIDYFVPMWGTKNSEEVKPEFEAPPSDSSLGCSFFLHLGSSLGLFSGPSSPN
jgi:uncharacterized protein YqgC (DUF456 family)